MAKKISFLVKTHTQKRVSFKSKGKKISFIARVPSKRRKRVSFYRKNGK